MRYVLITPGGTVEYDVPIMKIDTYPLDVLFEKELLMLIPFHIFSHEARFPEYDRDEQKLMEIETEYQDILERLDRAERKGALGAFDKRTIIEISGDVVRELARKYGNVQKGIGDIMRGALLDTEARRILDQGINQGINQGIDETRRRTALRMLKVGKLTIEEIAEYSELSITEVEQLAGLQTI